jgi:hypothetical protein
MGAPRSHKEPIDRRPFKLGSWASTRRRDRHKNNPYLSVERIAELDALGFDWDPYETSFQEGLKALRQHIEREGHARVPKRHKEALDDRPFNLGQWVGHRRRDRNKDDLSAERIAALNALGFRWGRD